MQSVYQEVPPVAKGRQPFGRRRHFLARNSVAPPPVLLGIVIATSGKGVGVSGTSAARSPDPIDEAMQVTGSAGWLQLGAVGLALLAALVWAGLTDVPIKVKGRGILLGQNGVADVTLSARGRIGAIGVRPGDVVAEGDLIAEISQPDTEMQLSVREVQLREAVSRELALVAFRRRSATAQDSSAASRIAGARQRMELLAERERNLRERDAISNDLFRRGLSTRDVLLRNQSELTTVIDQIATARSEIVATENELNLQQVQSEKEFLAVREEITRLTADVEETRRLLRANRELRSPTSGRVIEVKAAQGDFVEAGAAVVSLVLAAEPGQIVAIAYVAPESGKEIRPGMRVEIAAGGVKPNEYGFITGRVTAVSDGPVTSAGMNRALRNDQLVRQLAAQGAPFQIEVALDRADTPSGFRWTASRGPPGRIDSGTPCEANVTTRASRLLGLVVPPLARFFPS